MKTDIAFEWKALKSAIEIIATQRPIKARHVAYATALGSTYAALFGITRASLQLDDLLWPAHRDVRVKQPVFVTGPPRSGTTLLQNLLSLDQTRFAPMTLAHSLVPSVTLRKMFRRVIQFDQRCGAPVARAIERAERNALGALADVHPLSLSAPEEDMLLPLHAFSMAFVYLFVPYVKAMHAAGHTVEGIDDYSSKRANSLLDFYDGLVRRHLFDVGAERTFLTKNTSLSAGAMRAHLARYPDMRIVLLVRRPHECLPSMLSLAHRFWSQLDPSFSKTSPEFRTMYELARESYRNGYRVTDELPAEQVKVVRYEELVADPGQTVRDIYDWLGLEFTPELAAVLENKVNAARSYKSAHRYARAEFGLSAREIAMDLADVYRRFGWSMPQPTVMPPPTAATPISVFPNAADETPTDVRASWVPPAA